MSDDQFKLIDETISSFNSEHDVDTQPDERVKPTNHARNLSDLFTITYAGIFTDMLPAYNRFHEQVRYTTTTVGGEYIQPVILGAEHGIRYEEE